MNIEKKDYKKYAKAHAPKSPTLKNCIRAFVVGGAICTLGQGLMQIYKELCKLSEEDAGALVSCSLIFLAVALTALGFFDRIAKFAGAGTLLPVTGFANAVVSPAMDNKSEGFVMGVGNKIFTVCGPVILYGALSAMLYGTVYYILSLFSLV